MSSNLTTHNNPPCDIEEIDVYKNKKYPKKSVKLYNCDFQTIDYDVYTSEYNGKDSYRLRDLQVKFIIELSKVFYDKQINKPTWIKYNSNISSNNKSILILEDLKKYDDTVVFGKTIFTVYYEIKKIQNYIPYMKKAINIIYSDQTKSKKILEHPNYSKGKEYFVNAFEAVETMLKELELSSNLFIKNNAYYGNYTAEELKEYLTINPVVIKMIDSIEPSNRKITFKKRNTELYYQILTILNPCNFYQLIHNFLLYTYQIDTNTYLYNLMINN